MRNYLKDQLSSELTALNNDTALLGNFCAQNGLDLKQLDEATQKILMRVAKEYRLSIAFCLHVKLRVTSRAQVWANGLRDVLGETFTTEEDAIRDFSNEFSEKVDRLTAVKKRVQKELQVLKKGKQTVLTEAQAVSEKEAKETEYKAAMKGANLFVSCGSHDF